jgi:N-acetylglucosaminyldiphosphoundecaprenol N-acetyl-beta-D-mannosaminyltransferase
MVPSSARASSQVLSTKPSSAAAVESNAVPHPLSAERPRINVLGVGIDAIDMSTAVRRITSAVAAGEVGYVCVTGVHGVMEAQRDPAMRRILNSSLLTTPDGMPMVWLGRAAGFRRMRRVYGPELMLQLCRESAATGASHFLYGGSEGVAESLAKSLRQRFPGLRIVGTYTPPFRPLSADEERRLAQRLEELRPDYMWVGLSTPKQERFMSEYCGRLPVTVMLGVGAAFDMNSGRTKQAPRWMQSSGLEWLFRLFQEPHRLFKRYAKNNPAFVFRIAQQKLRLRRYSLDA